MVVDALTERPALDPEEEGSTAIRPGEPQRLEGPIPLGFAPLRALHEDLFRDARRPKAPMRLSKQFVRREECREVPGHRGRNAADLPSDRVVHLLAPFHEQGRYMGRYQKQSVLPRKWRRIGPQDPSAGRDSEQVGVHLRGEKSPGHQDARMDAVEDRSAEDARVEKPERELPVRARDDESQNAFVLVPPSDEEVGDLGEMGGDSAPDGIFARKREAFDERGVAARLAPLPLESRLDHVQKLVLAGDPLGGQRGEESFHRFRDAKEFMGHLPIDRPRFLRSLQQVHHGKVPDQMGADPVRKIVRLVDDEDQIVKRSSEPREESLADLAEHVIVVADDQSRFRGRVHRDSVRAHPTRAARPNELLHVQGPLEDRRDDRGVVPREERTRPRLHLEVTEFLERPAMGRRPLLEAHRVLRDQVDRRDPRPLCFDPPDRFDRDPMVALTRREEEDELVLDQCVVEGRHKRHRGLPDAGRRMGEQMHALRHGPPCIQEEVRLAVTDPIEGPRHRTGRQTDVGPEFHAFHEGLEGPVS